MSIFGGSKAIRERYKREYEAGLANLAAGYPAICTAMVQTAISGNPLAAKWVADQLNFGERLERDTSGPTQIIQLVLGQPTQQQQQQQSIPNALPPASIPAEWRVLPPPERTVSHNTHSAKLDTDGE